MSEVTTNTETQPEDSNPINTPHVEELQMNTIGNILGEELMHRAAQQAISIVNRTEDIEHELLSLPFHIQNFNWNQFCSEHHNDVNVVGSNFEQELSSNQILLSETKSYKDKTRVIISDPNHLIPHISGSDVFEFKTNNSKQVNQKGVLLIQQKGNMGIMTYLSFLPGKKIYGLFINSGADNVKQFYHVGSIGTEEIIPNVSLPSNFIPRDLQDILTEEDKLVMANASPRFRKRAEKLTTLKLALNYLNGLIEQTIDPAYINKLMVLNKTLSFLSN